MSQEFECIRSPRYFGTERGLDTIIDVYGGEGGTRVYTCVCINEPVLNSTLILEDKKLHLPMSPGSKGDLNDR